MKEQKLLQILGDIDDDLIEITPHRTQQPIRFLLGACAASVMLIATFALLPRDNTPPPIANDTTTTQAVTTTKRLPEVAIIPHWDEKSLAERFPEATYNGITYTVSSHTMDPQFVGNPICTVTMHGQDVYTDKEYTTAAVLYAVTSISAECAVAVQYEGSTAYYAAIGVWYTPKTLGQFVQDLNLEHYLEVGAIYLPNSTTPHDHLLSKQDLYQLLCENSSLPNVYKDQLWYERALGISVGIPILGIENVSITITTDGYLVTNLLHSGKAFFIGTEQVETLLQQLNITTTSATNTTTATGGTSTKPAQPPATSAAYIPE